jgi:hypothetical protein
MIIKKWATEIPGAFIMYPECLNVCLSQFCLKITYFVTVLWQSCVGRRKTYSLIYSFALLRRHLALFCQIFFHLFPAGFLP